MKNSKSVSILLLFLFLLPISLFAQAWTPKADIPTARWTPASVELDGKIYVLGGQGETSPYNALSKMEVYDQQTDSWTELQNMPTARWGLMTAVVDGKIYAIGGLEGSFMGGFTSTDVVEEYDPVTDTWTTKSALQVGRGYGGAVVYNDTIFVFGGYRTQSQTDLGTVEKYYPPSDIWVSTGIPMPYPHSTFMMTKVGTSAYLIGGWDNSGVEEYSFVTGEWTTKPQMPVAAGGSGIAANDSLIFIIGGRGGNFDEFQAFNLLNDTWHQLNTMPTAREGLVAEMVDGKVYCITGSDPSGFPFFKANQEARGMIVGVEKTEYLPTDFVLDQNYPNPFNPSTTIEYYLPKSTDVVLKIYNILGDEIKTLVNEYQSAGNKTYKWDGTDNAGQKTASGIYFYKAQLGEKVITKKMILMK